MPNGLAYGKSMTTTWTPFTGTPGNKRDRERFASITPWAQTRVRKMAGRLYDGTRTVARCWALALDAEIETS